MVAFTPGALHCIFIYLYRIFQRRRFELVRPFWLGLYAFNTSIGYVDTVVMPLTPQVWILVGLNVNSDLTRQRQNDGIKDGVMAIEHWKPIGAFTPNAPSYDFMQYRRRRFDIGASNINRPLICIHTSDHFRESNLNQSRPTMWYSVPLSHIWRPSSHWSVKFIICM